MLANGIAAMELQGDWDPGVMTALNSNKDFLSNVGWFPSPRRQRGSGRPVGAAGRW